MPWRPLPNGAIAHGVVTHPFDDAQGDDLPLELGDEVYICEQGGAQGDWARGYMRQQPSLLSGLSPLREGQGLEQRIYTGTFPLRNVAIREILNDNGEDQASGDDDDGRDSLGQINRANRAQEQLVFKNKLVEQLATNTLPIPHQNPGDEKPLAPVPHLKAVDEDSANGAQPLVDEISSVLKEWHGEHYHRLLLEKRYKDVEIIDAISAKLDNTRREMLYQTLTQSETEAVLGDAIWQINRGNKILNRQAIVRSSKKQGRMMDSNDSPIELSAAQSIVSLLDEAPKKQVTEKSTLNHLLVDVKSVINASLDPIVLDIFLICKPRDGELEIMTEVYSVKCDPQGSLDSLRNQITRCATLFADLSAEDAGLRVASATTQVYLVVKANRTYVPLTLKSTAARDSASVSRESLTSNSQSANTSSINAGKSIRRSIMMGNVKNVFSKPTKSANKMGSLQEAFEPPKSAEPRSSTASTASPPGTPGKAVSRTVAVGAINISELWKQRDAEVDAHIQLWTPSADHTTQNQGSDWDNIIRQLLPSSSGCYRRLPTLPKVELVLKPYNGQSAAMLVQDKPTELSGVTSTAKIGFSGAPTKARNDVYVTINKSSLPKNALLSRAVGSATSLSQRSDYNSVQVRLEVRNRKGAVIENTIHASSNGSAVSTYDTTVVGKNEGWNETIRLSIGPEEFKGAHLVLLTSDAPHYPFAISYIPLWQDNAFVRDGNHDLSMYRYDENISRALGDGRGTGGYLRVNWNARGKDDVSKDEALTGPLCTLRIKTYLCSTVMSQDKNILGLLNWKRQTQSDVAHYLKQILFCPQIEIVKQLDEAFDALFSILVAHSENETFEDLVFTALVHVLSIVYDRRFNLSPLVEKYAEEKFNFPFATPCLVKSFVRLLVATDSASSTKLRATFKVTKHLLKFITRGRSQQITKETDIGITHGSAGFSHHLSTLFNALNTMMRAREPALIANQTLAAQHFASWLPELDPLLSHDQIVHCAIDFVDAMRDVKGKLIIYKMILLIKFSELDLFSKKENRQPLVQNTVRWIKPYWGALDEASPQYREQVRLACTILSTQIDDLGDLADDHIPNVVNSYLTLLSSPRPLRTTNLSFLFPRTYPFPHRAMDNTTDNFDEVLIELAAVFSAISKTEHGLQLDHVAESKDQLANLVFNTLKMQESILNAEAFPKNWLSLYVYHHRSAMGIVEQLSAVMLDSFLPGVEELSEVVFLDGLWKLFFTTLFKLISSETLALETFAQQKRRAVWSIAGDVRKEGAKLLSKMWFALGWESEPDDQTRYGLKNMGGYQVQFVPGLVPSTLVLCMHVHEDLSATGTEMLKSMIASEWELNQSVTAIKIIIIDELDKIFRTKAFTEGSVQKNFVAELLNHFESRYIDNDDPMKVQIREMLYTISDFLDLLESVHASGSNDEANALIHRLALMEFLRDMDKTDIFIAYAHQLAAVQVAAGNFTEAGLALRHHADLYEWDTTRILPAISEPPYPSQTEFERKEAIFHEMVQRFEEGEAWGMALMGYDELAAQYADNIYDFNKVARTYKSMGNIYEQIAKPDRPLVKYFRVCYGGLGFPAAITQRQYIYESKPGESQADFQDRIQSECPEAQLVPNLEDVEGHEGQFLSIDTCSPLHEMDELVFQRTKVSNVVKEYLATRSPQQFTALIKKNTTGPVDEHYMDILCFTTEEPFPTISRRSQITEAEWKRLDAVQTAVERVRKMSKNLATWERSWIKGGGETSLDYLIKYLKAEVEPHASAVVHTRVLIPTDELRQLNAADLKDLLGAGDSSIGAIPPVELTDHEKALKTALIDLALVVDRILSHMDISEDSIARDSVEDIRAKFEPLFETELASVTPKAVVKVEDSQRPWNLPILSNGNGFVSSDRGDNRASNLSTLGPLGFANKRGTKQSRKYSTDSRDNISINTDTPQRVRVNGFWKHVTRAGETDSSAPDAKRSSRLGRRLSKKLTKRDLSDEGAEKSRRGPPVSLKNINGNANAGGKSIKRRDSDVASQKSSRRSFSSFSRRSFFGRGRADSNATEQYAVTDDGNGDWVTEGDDSRVFSHSNDGGMQQFDQNKRYISDSIYRGGSSVNSNSTQNPHARTASIVTNICQDRSGAVMADFSGGLIYRKTRRRRPSPIKEETESQMFRTPSPTGSVMVRPAFATATLSATPGFMASVASHGSIGHHPSRVSSRSWTVNSKLYDEAPSLGDIDTPTRRGGQAQHQSPGHFSVNSTFSETSEVIASPHFIPDMAGTQSLRTQSVASFRTASGLGSENDLRDIGVPTVWAHPGQILFGERFFAQQDEPQKDADVPNYVAKENRPQSPDCLFSYCRVLETGEHTDRALTPESEWINNIDDSYVNSPVPSLNSEMAQLAECYGPGWVRHVDMKNYYGRYDNEYHESVIPSLPEVLAQLAEHGGVELGRAGSELDLPLAFGPQPINAQFAQPPVYYRGPDGQLYFALAPQQLPQPGYGDPGFAAPFSPAQPADLDASPAMMDPAAQGHWEFIPNPVPQMGEQMGHPVRPPPGFEEMGQQRGHPIGPPPGFETTGQQMEPSMAAPSDSETTDQQMDSPDWLPAPLRKEVKLQRTGIRHDLFDPLNPSPMRPPPGFSTMDLRTGLPVAVYTGIIGMEHRYGGPIPLHPVSPLVDELESSPMGPLAAFSMMDERDYTPMGAPPGFPIMNQRDASPAGPPPVSPFMDQLSRAPTAVYAGIPGMEHRYGGPILPPPVAPLVNQRIYSPTELLAELSVFNERDYTPMGAPPGFPIMAQPHVSPMGPSPELPVMDHRDLSPMFAPRGFSPLDARNASPIGPPPGSPARPVSPLRQNPGPPPMGPLPPLPGLMPYVLPMPNPMQAPAPEPSRAPSEVTLHQPQALRAPNDQQRYLDDLEAALIARQVSPSEYSETSSEESVSDTPKASEASRPNLNMGSRPLPRQYEEEEEALTSSDEEGPVSATITRPTLVNRPATRVDQEEDSFDALDRAAMPPPPRRPSPISTPRRQPIPYLLMKRRVPSSPSRATSQPRGPFGETMPRRGYATVESPRRPRHPLASPPILGPGAGDSPLSDLSDEEVVPKLALAERGDEVVEKGSGDGDESVEEEGKKVLGKVETLKQKLGRMSVFTLFKDGKEKGRGREA